MTAYPSMQDKVILISGATDGIGKVTALQLAGLGATVVGLGRNPDKCARVASEIIATTGNPRVEFLTADLSSIAENIKAAAEFKRIYQRLDVLVNNAGAFFSRRALSVDSLEMTFALNHLGYFLLTRELTGLLIQSAPSRVVVVSSDAHTGGRINFNDLQAEKNYNGWMAYAQSKLANVLFTYELANRLKEKNVTVNALHPGFVATRFGRNNGPLYDIGMGIIQKVTAMSAEDGAKTNIYLAASPDVENVTGKYFVKCKEEASSRASRDMAAARKLWEISEQIANQRLNAGGS